MTSLILATSDFAGDMLKQARRADVVIGLKQRFVLGQLPSPAELMTFLERRSAKHHGYGAHWLDSIHPKSAAAVGGKDLGLLELCERCDSIELWADPEPNDQLVLIWLLDVLHQRQDIVSKLTLVQADTQGSDLGSSGLAQWRLPKLVVTDDRLSLASRAWNAYRAPTPEACFDLLMEDLTTIPRLRPAILALLEELPAPLTGLGETEFRMLALLSEGLQTPISLIEELGRERDVFDSQERELLLDRLAYCRTPVLAGFPAQEEPDDLKARYERFRENRLLIPDFGKEVLEQELDFSQYNPANRWWGGTELTPDRLWRWDIDDRRLIAP